MSHPQAYIRKTKVPEDAGMAAGNKGSQGQRQDGEQACGAGACGK